MLSVSFNIYVDDFKLLAVTIWISFFLLISSSINKWNIPEFIYWTVYFSKYCEYRLRWRRETILNRVSKSLIN